MKTNRTWLVFANETRCDHIACLQKEKFINWVQDRIKFTLGDIVYIFISTERRVRYKTKVTDIINSHSQREDSDYWHEKAPNDNSKCKLFLVDEYTGDDLNEAHLIKNGFKGGRSIQQPMCNNPQLFDYIKKCF